MKADEIRNLSDADLTARIGELQEEQFRLRFRSATETLEQPLRLRTIRRDIARILTVQRERALQQQSQAAGTSGASAKAAPQARRATRRSAKPSAAK
jgi:large subunit ribosomal protein L29